MTDPTASPFAGINLPPSYGVAQVALQQRATKYRRRARRNDLYRFAAWSIAGTLMITAVAVPRDYWPMLGLIMAVLAAFQGFLVWDGNRAHAQHMGVVFEAQFLAAQVMHDAYRNGELERHRDGT